MVKLRTVRTTPAAAEPAPPHDRVVRSRTGRSRNRNKILVLDTKVTALSKLRPYHKNPRVGNLDLIADSLDEHGQYRAILVNVGTKTGRAGEVLAGNHTFLAARDRLGWGEMLTSYVDVDEKTAAKIVLVDNKTSDVGTYEERLLAELLASLPDTEAYTGTGYTQDEVSSLTALLDQQAQQTREVVDDALDRADDHFSEPEGAASGGIGLGGPEDGELGAGIQDDTDDDGLDDAPDRLKGSLQLTNDVTFLPGWGRWDIPILRTDMLVRPEDLPEKLLAWAGSATRDTPENDDPDQWWFYNYGIDSTSGMKYRGNMILGFYTGDQYFERWYWEPARLTTKAKNTGVRIAVSPNFSMLREDPRFIHLQALFKNRWVGRYFQEAGIRVIPNLEWPIGHTEFLEKYVVRSLPRGVPVISLQGNSVMDPSARRDEKGEDRRSLAVEYRLIVEKLEPKLVLHYGSPFWNDWARGLNLPCEVRCVDNRLVALGERARQREKNTGL